MYILTHIYAYIYTCTHTDIYTCVHMKTYICKFVCMYACFCVHICRVIEAFYVWFYSYMKITRCDLLDTWWKSQVIFLIVLSILLLCNAVLSYKGLEKKNTHTHSDFYKENQQKIENIEDKKYQKYLQIVNEDKKKIINSDEWSLRWLFPAWITDSTNWVEILWSVVYISFEFCLFMNRKQAGPTLSGRGFLI